MTLLRSCLCALALGSLATPAVAGEVVLPLELDWCATRAEVEAKLSDANELTEGVIESQATAWGLRGTFTGVFEDDMLVTARFRLFETEKSYQQVLAALKKQHGDGVLKDRTKEGMARNLRHDWEVDAEQTVQLKISSEQIYVSWEVWASRCVAAEAERTGLTDAEKADIEASSKKKAINFDPLAEDIEDVDDRKKKADDAKKSAEEKEEAKAKEAEPDPDDVDIDW